jgi:hypothetical protein
LSFGVQQAANMQDKSE